MVTVTEMSADDPRVADLVRAHVALMDAGPEPPEACHRLDPDGLLDPSITFLVAMDGDVAVGIGAYAHRDPSWGEVKSMHVAAEHRGNGVARRLLSALEDEARRRGVGAVRLETGATMAPALRLYESSGYTRRGPFGGYADHPASVFLEKSLTS